MNTCAFSNQSPKHNEDNGPTVLFSLQNMIWHFRDCLGRYNSTIYKMEFFRGVINFPKTPL